MAVGDELTLRVVGRYQSQNIVNTLHYRIANQTASELLICERLIELWDTALRVLWTGRHIDTYTLVGLKAFRKTGVAKTPHFKLVTANGTVTGDEVPSPVCRCITLYTADAKPRRRGRIMLSGSEAGMFNQLDGGVTAAQITSLETMMTTMLTQLSGAGDEFDIGIPSTPTGIFQAITDSKPRVTPAIVTSRRIRQFLIG